MQANCILSAFVSKESGNYRIEIIKILKLELNCGVLFKIEI